MISLIHPFRLRAVTVSSPGAPLAVRAPVISPMEGA